jgi:5-methyltetrahydropteroyltriglutamate--homocysteine methyltransferase
MTSYWGDEDRILVTHVGSLPRPPQLLAAFAGEEPADAEQLAKLTDAAVQEAIRLQDSAGVDLIGDGEQDVLSFFDPRPRLTGFGGHAQRWMPADTVPGEIPPHAAVMMRAGDRIAPSNDAPMSYQPAHLAGRLARLDQTLNGRLPRSRVFVTAPSPGAVCMLGTTFYPDHAAHLEAAAAAMRQEYQAIAAAGYMLQVDAPDLAAEAHVTFHGRPAEFLSQVGTHVDAINEAISGIPAAQIRAHVCWSNSKTPHHYDVPLETIIAELYRLNAGTLMVPLANPRHQWEWEVFTRHPLPDGKILAAGVIDNNNSCAEHPMTVAQSLLRLAGVVGRDNLMASVDCGFATFADMPAAPPPVVQLKLGALAEGASIASDRLWSR